MGQAAHVQSLDALVDLHARLKRFQSEALGVVERAAQRLLVARQLIEDRVRHWRHVVAATEERVREAHSELQWCLDDDDRECSSEEDELYRSRRELGRAQESLETCRAWLGRFEEEAEHLEVRLRAFRELTETTLPGAMGFLAEARGDLDRYIAITAQPGVTGRVAGAGASAPSRVASTASASAAAGDLEASLDAENREVLSGRLAAMTTAQKAALAKVLAHPKADAAMLARALGRPEGNSANNLHDEMALALPEAMASIVDSDTDIGGLFARMELRGKGTAAALQRFGKGKAYEILATAKRLAMRQGALAIRAGHHISFGPKSQARYEQHDRIFQGLLDAVRTRDEGRGKKTRWASYRSKRKDSSARSTVESDLHLGIRTPEGWLEIMEDYKYSDKDEFGEDLRDGILGMGVALSSGEVHEARFICNTKLAERTREQIRDMNAVLASRGVEGRIEVHENFDWKHSP